MDRTIKFARAHPSSHLCGALYVPHKNSHSSIHSNPWQRTALLKQNTVSKRRITEVRAKNLHDQHGHFQFHPAVAWLQAHQTHTMPFISVSKVYFADVTLLREPREKDPSFSPITFSFMPVWRCDWRAPNGNVSHNQTSARATCGRPHNMCSVRAIILSLPSYFILSRSRWRQVNIGLYMGRGGERVTAGRQQVGTCHKTHLLCVCFIR